MGQQAGTSMGLIREVQFHGSIWYLLFYSQPHN